MFCIVLFRVFINFNLMSSLWFASPKQMGTLFQGNTFEGCIGRETSEEQIPTTLANIVVNKVDCAN